MKDCTYKNFNRKNLTSLKPTQQIIPVKPGQNPIPPAWLIPLQYNLGSPENPYFSDFEMVLCPFTSPVGISQKISTNETDGTTRVEESIMVKFDPGNEDHSACLETLTEVHERCAELLGGVKGQVKRFAFDAANPVAGGFKPLVYFPQDEDTGEIIPGRLGSMFLKLFSRGKDVLAEKTLFVDLHNKPIDRKLLMGVELKFIPLMSFKKIRVAAGITVISEMKSAIVISIKERNTESTMLSTLAELKEQQPELEATLDSQLAKLTMNRQTNILPPPVPSKEKEKEEEESNLNSLKPFSSEEHNEPESSPVTPIVPNATNKAPKRTFKIPSADAN